MPMTLEEAIKIASTTKAILPKAVPTLIEQQQGSEAYFKGFETGWNAYKNRIKNDLKVLSSFGGVLNLANFEQPFINEELHYAVGYTAGWNAYRRFLKKTFFG